MSRAIRSCALAAAGVVLLLAAAPAHAAEVCGDGQDNDSNGVADEGCYPYGVTGVCESTLSCDLAAVAPSTGSLVVPLAPDYDVHVPYGPALRLARTYYSMYEPGGGAHGYRTSMGRWNHNYMSWLDEHSGSNSAVVHTQTGQDVNFTKSGAPAGGYQYYVAQAGAHVDYLRQATTSPYAWELRSLTGEVAVYDSAGKLTELRDSLATPNVMALTYDGSGYLSTVTDAADTRRFVFTYTSNKLTKVSLQKKASGTYSEDTYVTYSYTSGELTGVSFGGTSAQTNTYSGGYLTRIDDAAGNAYLQFAYSSANAGQVVRVHSASGVLGREYSSAHASCTGETQQFFERANATACDDDADCGAGNRCGGETNPAAANTGVCFRASTCLTAAATIEDLVAAIDPILPCDGACAPVAAYSWDTGTGNAKLELAGVQDGEGHWRSYDYNADGQVTLSAHGDTDADPTNASSGARTWYFYDTAFPGRLTERRSLSVLKPAGTCSDSVSTDCARTLQTWSSDGRLTALEQRGFTLDSSGAVDDFTYTETRSYDSFGRLTATDGPLPGADDETTFSYYSSGTYDKGMLQTVAVEKSAGAFQSTTFSSYDIWGKPNQHELPGSIYSCRDFDNHRGWVVSQRQAMSTNTCSTTHASDLTVVIDYDTWGRRTKETRPEGNCVHYTYDSTGRVTNIKRRDDCNAASGGDTVSYAYDDDSNLTDVRYKDDADTAQYRAQHTYYASGRLQRRVNAANASFGKDFAYLEDGSLFSLEGENGVGLTEWTRDALARAQKVYRYNDATDSELTELTYPAGSRTSLASAIEDDLGDTSERVRDDLGRVVKVVSKAGETTLLVRDEGGRVSLRLDPGNVQNWFTYDSLGRLLTVDLRHEACAAGASAYETEFTYDATPGSCPAGRSCANVNGHLAHVRTRLLCDSSKADKSLDMETYYGYDRAGRMTEETIRDDAGRSADTTYTWDKNGNRTQLSLPSGAGAAATYGGGSSNGDRDKPVTVVRKDNSGDTTLLSGVLWMPSGPVAQYDQANTIGGTAIRATLAWNKEYRSPDVLYATGATDRFRLDIDENQQGKETYRNVTGAQSGVQDQRLKWDWQGRLRCDSLTTSACPTSGSNLRTNLTTFNGADGRLTWVHKGVATGTQSGSNVYGNGTQIDYITLDGSTLDFVWDARGNRTSDDLATASNDARSYTYDGNRRVRTISGQYYANGAWVTYTITNAYDHQGRRYLRSFIVGGLESQTFYSYDEENVLVEVTHTPDVSAPTTYAVYQLYWLGDRPVALYATSYVSGSPTVARYFTTADDAHDVLELTSWPSSGDATVVWAVNQDAFGWDDVVVGSGVFQPLGKDGWIREGSSEAWHGTTTVGRPPLQCRGGVYVDPMTGGWVQSDYVPGRSHIAAGRHWDGDHCSTIDNGVPSGDVNWDDGSWDEPDCEGVDKYSFACNDWGGGGMGDGGPGGNGGSGGGGGDFSTGWFDGLDPNIPLVDLQLECLHAQQAQDECDSVYGEESNCDTLQVEAQAACEGVPMPDGLRPQRPPKLPGFYRDVPPAWVLWR